MSKRNDIQNSILIVSASEQFTAEVKKSLHGFITIDIAKSAARARRCILERSYDIVVINIPLSDESGEMLALDAAESNSTSVLAAVPREVYGAALERFSDCGILAVSKPLEHGILDKAVRFLTAVQGRMHAEEKKIRKLEDKMEELRVVSRAKLLLIEKKHMTEDEAHRFIGKLAMDNGVSRRAAAESLLE